MTVFNTQRFLDGCNDENGRVVFSRILEWAKEKNMLINPGNPGFSVNVGLGRTRVAFCYGNPPQSGRGFNVSVPLRAINAVGKTAIPEADIQHLEELALSTGIFEPAGRQSLKCPIPHRLADREDGVDSLLAWFELLAEAIQEYGPKQ